MANIMKIALSLFLLVAGVVLQAQQPKTDPVTFPENGTIRYFKISNYTFPFSEQTNCYLLTGKTGEAILIDPADQLDPVTDKETGLPLKRILADRETGESILIDAKQLVEYKVVRTNNFGDPVIVQDPATGREKYVYDRFRTTNLYAPQILKYLNEHKLKLKYIVISHGHLDHFAGVTYLQEKTGAKVLMHEDDLRSLTGGKLVKQDGVPLVGYPKDTYRIEGVSTKIDQPLRDGDLISLDGMVLRVIHTPGHSPGSICLYTKQETKQGTKPILFSGDTLLRWGYLRDAMGNILYDADGNAMTADTGRTNFLDGSGDEALLYRMLREKLFVLPENTIVYPGHYDTTTIGEEKKHSPARLVKPEKKTNPPAEKPATNNTI